MTVRPFNISATLRFSETDLQERGFLDAIRDGQIHDKYRPNLVFEFSEF